MASATKVALRDDETGATFQGDHLGADPVTRYRSNGQQWP
jgi:hypothetical protein